jgi:branched-chain amino acid transport system permease protein
MIKRNFIKRGEVYFIIIVGLLPLLIRDVFFNHVMVIAGIYSIAALGLSLFMGYAGQISIGHSAFFGIGGYGMAILTTRYGFHPVPALIASALITGIFALIIGKPMLRLREYFLALATIGLVHIFQVFVMELRGVTGGIAGISDIPWFSIWILTFDTALEQFYLVWVILYLLYLFSRNLVHSRFGRASLAVACSEDTSKTIGIDPSSMKLKMFVLSAMYSGISGGLFACVITSVNPDTFNLYMSVILVMMVIIGGIGTLFGAIAGAIVLTWITNLLSEYQEFSLPIFGIILILFLIFLPEGIFRGIGSRWIDFVRSYADDSWRREIER